MLSVDRPLDHAAKPALEEQGDEVQHEAIDLRAVLEDDVGREATGAEGIQELTVPVYIDRDHARALAELIREFLYDRQLPDTGASPIGVEITKTTPRLAFTSDRAVLGSSDSSADGASAAIGIAPSNKPTTRQQVGMTSFTILLRGVEAPLLRAHRRTEGRAR